MYINRYSLLYSVLYIISIDRRTFLAMGVLKSERAVAFVLLPYRNALSPVLARLIDTGMLAVVDVDAVQRFVQQLQRALVDDDLRMN